MNGTARTSSTLGVGYLYSVINLSQGLDDAVVGADEVTRLERRGTSAAQDASPGVATNDGNLFQTLLLIKA